MKKEPKVLSELFRKVVRLLEKEKIGYLVIGGVAVSHLGAPRLTEDLDLILYLEKKEVEKFLGLAKKIGLEFNLKDQLQSLESTGCFRIFWPPLRVDIICASTDFETEAFKRKYRVPCFGMKADFPSPEDFILLKIIPGREKDILDAESVALRHWGKLDIPYIESWIHKFCDRSENYGFMNHFRRIIDSCKRKLEEKGTGH
ncbi:MAG: nucleotidyltransferase [Elusimicrobia bacterium]|nr:nucleotidyltransferase [Elusimicrobiota bacterium]